MSRGTARSRFNEALLLCAALFAYLPHLPQQPRAVLAYCALLLGTRWFPLTKMAPSLARVGVQRWLLGCGFALLGLLLFAQQDLSELTLAISFLLVITSAKLMHYRHNEDALAIIALLLVVACLAFYQSESPLYRLCVGLCFLLSVSYLFSMYGSVTAWAWLTPARLLVMATLISSGVYPWLPSNAQPFWLRPISSPIGSVGVAEQLLPGQFSGLAENNAVAFRVQFPEIESSEIESSETNNPVIKNEATTHPKPNIPKPEQWYWRGPVFTHFDGEKWQPGNSTLDYIEASPSPHQAGPLVSKESYTVWLTTHSTRRLFVLDPATVSDDHAILRSEQNEYFGDSGSPDIQRLTLRSDPHPSDTTTAVQDPAVYLQLPVLYGPRARAMVNDWGLGLATKPDRSQQLVTLALNHFRDQPYYYSKTPPRLGVDPVDEFLFQTREGYCEHFASAFTFLMRAAGVPARVVSGYHGAEPSLRGDYWIVRESNAHAWAEVWLQNQGWQRVDPTRVIPDERVKLETQPGLGFVPLARLGDWLQHWLREGQEYSVFHWQVYRAEKENRQQMQALVTRTLLLGVLLPGALFSLIYSIRRRGALPTLNRRARAHRLFQGFCKKCEGLGLHHHHYDDAQTLASRIGAHRPDLLAKANQVVRLYNTLVYARDPAFALLAELKLAIKRFK